MSTDEAKTLLPGNRVILGDMPGKVQAIGYGQRPDDGEHFVKVTIDFDNGSRGTVSGSFLDDLRRDMGAWTGVLA